MDFDSFEEDSIREEVVLCVRVRDDRVSVEQSRE